MSEEKNSISDLEYMVNRTIGYYGQAAQGSQPFPMKAITHIHDATRPVRNLIEPAMDSALGHVGPLLVRRPRRSEP